MFGYMQLFLLSPPAPTSSRQWKKMRKTAAQNQAQKVWPVVLLVNCITATLNAICFEQGILSVNHRREEEEKEEEEIQEEEEQKAL